VSVFAAGALEFFRQSAFRHHVRVVGFPALCFRLSYRVALHAGNLEEIRGAGAAVGPIIVDQFYRCQVCGRGGTAHIIQENPAESPKE